MHERDAKNERMGQGTHRDETEHFVREIHNLLYDPFSLALSGPHSLGISSRSVKTWWEGAFFFLALGFSAADESSFSSSAGCFFFFLPATSKAAADAAGSFLLAVLSFSPPFSSFSLLFLARRLRLPGAVADVSCSSSPLTASAGEGSGSALEEDRLGAMVNRVASEEEDGERSR